ncbi:hypothetical protein G7Y41_08360 [Schaalia sp. ZJ405]|uniref:HD domain-containing protein n=1 Tax=Schaalia sp. ZJ405 TaxID=2709403 RepID=UPI0013ED0CA2|nr:hypothetical protein [Schaalia sp. ZJ405]QPK81042.1 hypothetical protein G7Y41_08360 [Schaalia sp. ZJ405]
MGAQAPQWLLDSFVESLQQIGATAPTVELHQEARDLADHWCTPDRHLHTIRHLIDMLTRIDEIADTAHDPDILRISAWYHGAFLNKSLEVKFKNPSNWQSTRCIDHAHNRLTTLGVDSDIVARIDELIAFLTRHRAPRSDSDAQVVVDADLAVLASSPQDYKKFREKLRLELDDLDELTYLTGRRALVKTLLSYDPLYQSPLGDTWEAPARANLEVELTKIDEKLCDLDPACLATDEGDGVNEADTSAESGDEMTTTGTLIIKKRSLKKASSAPVDDAPVTCSIPVLQPVEDQNSGDEDEAENTSSLESAIESIDLPSTRE